MNNASVSSSSTIKKATSEYSLKQQLEMLQMQAKRSKPVTLGKKRKAPKHKVREGMGPAHTPMSTSNHHGSKSRDAKKKYKSGINSILSNRKSFVKKRRAHY